MTKIGKFNPDWVSPPGATIADILRERRMRPAEFARQLDWPVHSVHALIRGDMRITKELAPRLAKLLGASTAFWNKREAQYREGLELMKKTKNKTTKAKAKAKAPQENMPRDTKRGKAWTKLETRDLHGGKSSGKTVHTTAEAQLATWIVFNANGSTEHVADELVEPLKALFAYAWKRIGAAGNE